MNLIFREISFGSEAYPQTVKLREEVLRKPLGLEFSREQLDSEAGDYHLCVMAEQGPLACLVLTPHAEGCLRMRQVAVSPDHQKNGIGRLLVAFSEGFAIEKYCREMVLHAREEAIPFYKKLGYKVYDEPFKELEIPHRKMKKVLPAPRIFRNSYKKGMGGNYEKSNFEDWETRPGK
ncbi:MAG: GNAT family N-acetyltransferase [Bacteroidia bacterium]